MISRQDEFSYLVGGSRPWNRTLFEAVISEFPGQWKFISTSAELTVERVKEIMPRYVFFLHWSEKVDMQILAGWECVCFHMTDVPYGRGGSPLQNLISRGLRSTKLTALRMTERFDAGPVYLKRDLSLEGTAEEIYLRAGRLSAEMIREIIDTDIQPQPQSGEVVVFRRRQPNESRVPENLTLDSLFDFVRMLDADGYPRAFLDFGGFRYHFRRAALRDGRIDADVQITPLQERNI